MKLKRAEVQILEMVKIKPGLGPAATTPTADPAEQHSLVRFVGSCVRIPLRGGMIKGDKIVLRGLEFHGYHGVKPEERESCRTLLINVDAWMDLEAAGVSDHLSDTICYTDIYRYLHRLCIHKGLANINGFMDPLLIQNIGNKRVEVQTYIQRRIGEARK